MSVIMEQYRVQKCKSAVAEEHHDTSLRPLTLTLRLTRRPASTTLRSANMICQCNLSISPTSCSQRRREKGVEMAWHHPCMKI